jgi:hypothetical protein
MDRDEYADMFRYRMGQSVRWADVPYERHWVGQRRWTQREVMGPVVEYRLRMNKARGGFLGWVYESELEAWEE